MSARFEIKVMGKGLYMIHDDYWDSCNIERKDTARGIVADAINLVEEQISSGSKEKWFAVGESGHSKIYDKPTICIPIPGRHKRYKI